MLLRDLSAQSSTYFSIYIKITNGIVSIFDIPVLTEHGDNDEIEGSSSDASSTRVGSLSTTASSAADATAMFTLALATFAFNRALLELHVVVAANFVAFVQAQTATAVLSAALSYLYGG